jgi:hypothetical protein
VYVVCDSSLDSHGTLPFTLGSLASSHSLENPQKTFSLQQKDERTHSYHVFIRRWVAQVHLPNMNSCIPPNTLVREIPGLFDEGDTEAHRGKVTSPRISLLVKIWARTWIRVCLTANFLPTRPNDPAWVWQSWGYRKEEWSRHQTYHSLITEASTKELDRKPLGRWTWSFDMHWKVVRWPSPRPVPSEEKEL